MAYYYNREFLETLSGSGMSHRHTFKDKKTNVFKREEKIEDSMYSILSTRIGERFFLPEYGSNLHLVLFEPNDMIAADLIDMYIRDALAKWEKRIEVVDIEIREIEDNNNIVPIGIRYKVTNNNTIQTYVYPFNIGDHGDVDIYEYGTVEGEAS